MGSMKIPKRDPLKIAKKQALSRLEDLPSTVSVVILDDMRLEDYHWLNEQLNRIFSEYTSDEDCMGMVIDVPNKRIEEELY
jgi:hypothetical protein